MTALPAGAHARPLLIPIKTDDRQDRHIVRDRSAPTQEKCAIDSGSTVFVVDDDPAVRDALETVLEAAGLQARSYASAEAFLAALPALGHGCLVLDVNMPGMSGLELQERLIRERVEFPIIFITGHGDVATSVKALRRGAVDFLEKPFDNQVLLDRIRDGIARDRKRREHDAAMAAAVAPFDHLTAREQEVMDLVVAGQSSRQIGETLGISRRTVETHRARILHKIGVRSSSELVAAAIETARFRRDHGDARKPSC